MELGPLESNNIEKFNLFQKKTGLNKSFRGEPPKDSLPNIDKEVVKLKGTASQMREHLSKNVKFSFLMPVLSIEIASKGVKDLYQEAKPLTKEERNTAESNKREPLRGSKLTKEIVDVSLLGLGSAVVAPMFATLIPFVPLFLAASVADTALHWNSFKQNSDGIERTVEGYISDENFIK